MLKRVKLEMWHENCWSSKIPYSTYTIDREVYPHKNYVRKRMVIETSDKEVLKYLRSHPRIVKIVNVWKSKDGLYVDFIDSYKGSIAGIFYDKEVLILGFNIREGREVWDFVINNKSMSEIINDLQSAGKIVNLKVYDFDPFLSPGLTDTEKRILYLAYAYGYLDYPRRASADEIAEKLGLSKVTFLYHLRNAQRKLTEFVVKNHKI